MFLGNQRRIILNNVNTMTNNWIKTYKKLPFKKKEELFHALAEKLDKATNDNDGTRINRIEKSLTRKLVKSWNTTTNKAIRTALRSFGTGERRFTQKDADKVLKALDKAYKDVEKKTEKRVKRDTREIYKINKKSFGRKFKLSSTPNEEKSVVIFQGLKFDPLEKRVVSDNYIVKSWNGIDVFKAVEFGIIDKEAYENLARLENISIGDHFPKTLKSKVSKAIQEGVLDKGLNKTDAAAFLQQSLTKTLGGSIQGALPASVAQGQASVNAYFEMLTATNVTYARNFSQMNLMNEAGIEQFIFNAVLDRLTSKICDQMEGRIFTIEQGMKHQVSVLAAENVEALKKIAPFQRDLSSFGLKEGQKLDDVSTSEKLAKAGVIIPPLHGRCRSDIQPL